MSYIVVSIPHRYDPNGLVYVIYSAKEVFQFLIGTIQTLEEENRKLRQEKEFQFLIGTIQTEKLLRELRVKIRFQFLIGTIQTK